MGVFTPEKPRVLWVGIEREPHLLSLRDKIEQALIRAGLPPEPRKFSPHVTLARLRNPALDRLRDFLARNAAFRADPFAVSRFSLVASFPTKAGSVYEDQADYPLEPPANASLPLERQNRR
jgi:2'-5' RNA ligase